MGKGILAGASVGGGTNIPVTSDPADNVQIWIDPNEEDQNEQFYTKDETEDYVKITAALKDLSNVDNSALLAAIESAGGGGAKFVYGSYTGTGTYGTSNKNTLTFDFEPKFLIVTTMSGFNYSIYSGKAAVNQSFIWLDGVKYSYVFDQSDGNEQCFISKSGNTISWYTTKDATTQCNYSNNVYYYIAIG